MEKRQWIRKPIQLIATYSYYAGTFVTSTGQTVTLNFSERGALIQMSAPVPIDEIITLKLNLDLGGLVVLEAHVVHVGTPKNGIYPIGVSFRNLTVDDEYRLNRQMHKDSGAPGQEKRRAPRKPISIVARYSYYAKTYITAMGETVTVNLSQRGALIQLKEPVPVNEIIMLTLNVERGNPIVLETRVAHVSPATQNQFAIGIEFKNLTSNDEYLLGLQMNSKGSSA